MQRMFKRSVATVALVAPLTVGMTGIASADSFSHHNDSAGPHGASTSNVSTSTNGGSGGGSSYHSDWSHAGPHGASSSSTDSNAGANTGSNSGIGDLLGGLL